jgi:uncharacterized membrane protein YwaF
MILLIIYYINTMFKHIISGNNYIFTRKQPNNANIETFRATFQDYITCYQCIRSEYEFTMLYANNAN